MIKMTLLSGPFSGVTKIIPADQNPREFMHSIFDHGWKWSIDYSQATDEEKFEWFREDMSVRCVRAIANGLPVKFMDKVFQEKTGDPEKMKEVVGKLEDAIVESGRLVTLERDDDRGIVISTQGFEQ